LASAAGYAWALRNDHELAPVLSVGTGILLAAMLVSLRSSAGRTQWTREPDPELTLLKREVDEARAVIADLGERARVAEDLPHDLTGAVAQIGHLQEELAERKELLREARSERPSLEELLEAAWHPAEGRPSPQYEADIARLREALKSSERELRRAKEQMVSLAEDPSRPDDRLGELQEALRRSDAERALLRAGRPETVWEARVRELERRLRLAEARASAVSSLSDGADEMVAHIERAEAGRLAAEDHARQAEERAAAVEIRARELAREVKTRFAEAEKSWQATAAGELARLRAELRVTSENLSAAEERADAAAASSSFPSTVGSDGLGMVDASVIAELEARVEEAEHRAQEAELLLHEIAQTDEERAVNVASELRSRLSRVTGQRRVGSPPSRAPLFPARDAGPLDDLREAVAYELRGPVASLRGLAPALRGAVTTADGRDLVRQITTNVRKIDQLVTDLAAAAKLAEGSIRLRRRRIDVTTLVTRVVDEADGFENRVLLLDGEPVSLSVDPARVEQMVDSLLANARERTTKGQTIRVHVGATDDGGAVISIDDDGRGKPELGAELSLAIRLAEAHGGRLWMEPLAKGGASYRLELRAASAGAAREASA